MSEQLLHSLLPAAHVYESPRENNHCESSNCYSYNCSRRQARRMTVFRNWSSCRCCRSWASCRGSLYRGGGCRTRRGGCPRCRPLFFGEVLSRTELYSSILCIVKLSLVRECGILVAKLDAAQITEFEETNRIYHSHHSLKTCSRGRAVEKDRVRIIDR
jgi:hypothetical protein